MAFYNGQGGSLVVGSVTFHVAEWSAQLNTEILDVTNTASAGYDTLIAGVSGGEVSFKIHYAGTPGLAQAQTAIFSGVLGGSGDTLSGTVIISGIQFSTAARGAVEMSCTARFTGVITMPV